MIKFSWERINNKFDWNGYKVLQYFYEKQGIKPNIPLYNTKKLKEALEPYPTGECFVININEVLKNTPGSGYLYNYLELASKRSLFDYKMRGVKTLPLILVPEYLMGIVETNPMLKEKDGNIIFKYE